MAWGKNGTPSTLTGAGDVMTISDLTVKKFNVILAHTLQSGANDVGIRFDNISTNTYAQRYSQNGGADGTTASTSYLIPIRPQSAAFDGFGITYFINISAEEKLAIHFSIDQNTAGAGNAPSRMETVGKYAQTSSQIIRIDEINFAAGDFAIGSNISLLGTD